MKKDDRVGRLFQLETNFADVLEKFCLLLQSFSRVKAKEKSQHNIVTFLLLK